MHKKIITFALTLFLVACATFEPKPGMTFEQFRSMTALSFNGSVIPLGKLTGTNIDVYETFDQNFHRVTRREQAPAGGWKYFYFSNGRLMDQKDVQVIIDQRAAQQRREEQDKAAALTKRQADAEARAAQRRLEEQDRAAYLAQQQADAQARAAKAQKDEAARKEQQQNQQKLNQF